MNINPEVYKAKFERETGLAFTYRFYSKGSMKGYFSFRPKKLKGQWLDIPFKYAQELQSSLEEQGHIVPFCSVSQINIYAGSSGYEWARLKREAKANKPVKPSVEVQKIEVEPKTVNTKICARKACSEPTETPRHKYCGDVCKTKAKWVREAEKNPYSGNNNSQFRLDMKCRRYARNLKRGVTGVRYW